MSKQVITFGCRLNSFESEVINNILQEKSDSNIMVFNTCAVTKEAERQARQSIRRIKKDNPDAKIIVTGCSAQINPSQYENMPEVSNILGNQEKLDARYYDFSENSNIPRTQVNDIMQVKETANHLISGFEDKVRAFVEIQNGCNHRCTFCIIPFGRGNNRSVPMGGIVDQIKKLSDAGYNEVVLTGVDITDYGSDLPGKPKLGQMIRRLLNLVPNLPRLRLSSVDVAEIDDELKDLIINEPRIMPHLHISLQSGDDMILKRMKRRHNRQQVIDFCRDIKNKRPDITFGADIIAGFPTETEEMFLNTLNLIDEVNIVYAHIFPFSTRYDTPAARMPQLDGNIIKQRAARLRKAGKKQFLSFLQQKIGTIGSVIVEKDNLARSEDFSMVLLNKPAKIGQILKVKIISVDGDKLQAEII